MLKKSLKNLFQLLSVFIFHIEIPSNSPTLGARREKR